MKTSLYDYLLPEELIAQHPSENRDESRLMVLSTTDGSIEDKHFYNIIDYLDEDDLLVMNNSKVFPARLTGKKIPTGTDVEVFLLRRTEHNIYEALVKPGKRLRIGSEIEFENENYSLKAEVTDNTDIGRVVRFENIPDLDNALEDLGNIPLPPYITRQATEEDIKRYQTIYADEKGSVAAPTAGLHFSEKLLNDIRNKNIDIVNVTLHVGPGTFKPVKAEDLSQHKMDKEYFKITGAAIAKIKAARKNSKRIVAVGTTSVRVLESLPSPLPDSGDYSSSTEIFIFPPYKFRYVDALITNFHLPKSTLLMLVAALAGREKILKAYQRAVENKYRFYSYGDAMVVL